MARGYSTAKGKAQNRWVEKNPEKRRKIDLKRLKSGDIRRRNKARELDMIDKIKENVELIDGDPESLLAKLTREESKGEKMSKCVPGRNRHRYGFKKYFEEPEGKKCIWCGKPKPYKDGVEPSSLKTSE